MPADISSPLKPIVLDESVLAALTAREDVSGHKAFDADAADDHDCADCD